MLINAPTYNYTSDVQFIVSSKDGGKLFLALGGRQYRLNSSASPLYTSADLGMTWTSNNAPVTTWQCAAASADGNKLVAVINGGGIYTSTNFGLTWISNMAPNKSWTAVASSADGTKLVAAATGPVGGGINSGGIYTTTNAGINWVSNSVPNAAWFSVASSADGNKLVAAAGGYSASGPIYSSTNSGVNWVSNSAPITHWTSVVSSADGSKQYASIVPGALCYSSVMPPSPQLNISPSSNCVALSWIIPSTDFVLQQSTDLISWTNITDTPTLNLTNLQNQVSLSPSNSVDFFRLSTP